MALPLSKHSYTLPALDHPSSRPLAISVVDPRQSGGAGLKVASRACRVLGKFDNEANLSRRCLLHDTCKVPVIDV